MSPKCTVLVVDLDETTRYLLERRLQARCAVLTAADRADAARVLSSTPVDALLISMHLSQGVDPWAGARLRGLAGEVPVLFVAGVQADETPPVLVGRPIALGDVAGVLEDAVAEQQVTTAEAAMRQAATDASGIIAESRAMRAVLRLIDRAAQVDTPVLLIGESGTGKELLAQALHAKSSRAHSPFVAVNCSAIPETLLENELFGHRQGAFTDARRDQLGLFQNADHGTIFLDEIGDMAPALQGKLLRVLQEKEVQPLGTPAPVRIDVRILAATHRDLQSLVAEGRFREDLLYRINVVDIHIPPLRERPDDLLPLLAHLIGKHCARRARPRATIAADALERLRRHSWPGNVRELENVIERALVLGGGTAIHIDDLPDALRHPPAPPLPRRVNRPLVAVEREHILKTLRAVDGNKSAAARALGLDRKTLYRKLQRGGTAR